MAYGDDLKKADEDDSGNSAFSMCPGSCDEILAEAEGIAEEVKKRREARKAREDAELDEDDDDDVSFVCTLFNNKVSLICSL